jgi:hypothetical protein
MSDTIKNLEKEKAEIGTELARKEVKGLGVQMQAVTSSNVASIGYDYDKKILYVRFKDGSLYEYPNKSAQTYSSFLDSSSKGKFVWKFLRGTGEKKIS